VKRLSAIFLLLLLLLPFAGSYWWLRLEQAAIKKQVKEFIVKTMDSNEFIQLKFAKSELKSLLEWEHSKEFIYDNKFYDVVSAIETADSVEYTVWEDGAETLIEQKIKQLYAYVLGNSSETQKNNQKRLKLLIAPYLLADNHWVLNTHYQNYSATFSYTNQYQYWFEIDIAHPPQFSL
jgi:hypothetical protein